jgi:Mrp family chromosome partitioning ATPase
MSKVLDALRQRQSRPSGRATAIPAASPPRYGESPPAAAPEAADPATMPYIEVGAPPGVIDASPEVLAVPLPRWRPLPAAGEPSAVRPAPAAPARRIEFQPLPMHPRVLKPAAERFAADLVAFHHPDEPPSQQYRRLLEDLTAASPGIQVMLFSEYGHAGAATVLLNTAITAAGLGKRVLVADCDFSRPAVADALGLPPVPGVRELLAGQAPLLRAVQESGLPSLRVLAAGAADVNLPAAPTAPLLAQLRDRFDLVLIAVPSWDRRSDWNSLATLGDALFLVCPPNEPDSAAAQLLASESRQHTLPLRGFIHVRQG